MPKHSASVVEVDECTFPEEGLPFEQLPPDIQEKAIDTNRYYHTEFMDWWDNSYHDMHDSLGQYGIEADKFYFSLDRDRHLEATTLRVSDHALFCRKFNLIISPKFHIALDSSKYRVTATLDTPWDASASEGHIGERINSLFHDFLENLEAEYEHLTSDETIREALTCTDYRFDEEGSIV